MTGYSDSRSYKADVYVFAILIATMHDEYDAFDTDRWQFWVLPRAVIQQRAANSISLPTVQRLAGDALAYADLQATIPTALAVSS